MDKRSLALAALFLAATLAVYGIYVTYHRSVAPASAPSAHLQTTMPNFSLTSPAFPDGGAIPQVYACDGQGISPELAITDVPAGTKSLALVLHDPDAPRPGGFVHWVAYDIPVGTDRIPEGKEPSGIPGKNGTRKTGYFGPCPPSGEHRYYFHLYALDALIGTTGLDRAGLDAAMKGHILAETQLLGRYKKH